MHSTMQVSDTLFLFRTIVVNDVCFVNSVLLSVEKHFRFPKSTFRKIMCNWEMFVSKESNMLCKSLLFRQKKHNEDFWVLHAKKASVTVKVSKGTVGDSLGCLVKLTSSFPHKTAKKSHPYFTAFLRMCLRYCTVLYDRKNGWHCYSNERNETIQDKIIGYFSITSNPSLHIPYLLKYFANTLKYSAVIGRLPWHKQK